MKLSFPLSFLFDAIVAGLLFGQVASRYTGSASAWGEREAVTACMWMVAILFLRKALEK